MPRRLPSDAFDRLVERIDRLADDAGLQEPGILHEVDVDVMDRDEEIVVRADLPGFTKDDVEVRVNGNRLTISAQRTKETEEAEENYYRRERLGNEVRRSLELPVEVDGDNASANFDDGVLEIKLPKIGLSDRGEEISIE